MKPSTLIDKRLVEKLVSDKANILYPLLAFLSIKMSIKCEVTQKLLIVTEDNKLYLFY